MDTKALLKTLPSRARQYKKDHQRFLKQLRERKPKDLDSQVHTADKEVFEKTDCLECANCCKTISPVFKDRDIQRLAKVFSLSFKDFTDQYLYRDEDGDYVLRQTPCPFLQDDNKCLVYEHRPEACRSYPHTGRRKFHRLLSITEKNLAVCPAAFEIVGRLREVYQQG